MIADDLVSSEDQDCAIGEDLKVHELPTLLLSGSGLHLDSLRDFERPIFKSDGVNVNGDVFWRFHMSLPLMR